jgi:hypothetical protein
MEHVIHPQASPVMGAAVHPVLRCGTVLEEAFYRCLNGCANATDMRLLLEFQRDWARSEHSNEAIRTLKALCGPFDLGPENPKTNSLREKTE